MTERSRRVTNAAADTATCGYADDMELSQNWLLMALLTPTLLAIDCLVASCLIGRKIYRAPSDGAIVSCLFCLLPAMAILGWHRGEVPGPPNASGLPLGAVLAGIAFAVHLLFYFRTLFRLNDVSGAETFISLSVLIVPLFAWLLLGEVLPARFYLAFVIATGGILLQCLPVLRSMGLSMTVDMLVAVVSISLSMVLQARALETHGFASATLAFDLSCCTLAAGVVLCRPRLRRRLLSLGRSFAGVLIASELLGLLAVMSSHRATQYGPSVSVVALIECLLPLIIILVSLTLIGLNRYAPLLREHRETLMLQVRDVPSKAAALTLLLISVASLPL